MRTAGILLVLILLLVGCASGDGGNPSEDPTTDSRTGALEGREPEPPPRESPPPNEDQEAPAASTPLRFLIPDRWVDTCGQYLKPVMAATYRYGDSQDQPMMYMVQIRRESACDPMAESHAGAQGLGQIMPATQKDLRDRLGVEIDVWDAGENIRGTLVIDQDMRRFWNPDYRSWCDRVALMYGGYNSGNGHWHNAQKACRADGRSECNSFMAMAEYVPDLNPHGARENIHYVAWITRNWHDIMPDEACQPYDATHFLE